MFKGEKGITLVALVITIIVLLILAGVSISLVIGQNGVLGKATNAVSTNEKATAEQEVKLGAADCLVNYYDAWVNDQSVKRSTYFTDVTFKANSADATKVTVSNTITTPADTGTIEVTNNGYTFTVNIETGVVTEKVQ